MQSIKILEATNDYVIAGGYGVVFGGEDLDGEYFGPDTNFMLDLVPEKPVFIDHTEESLVLSEDKKTYYKLLGISDPVGKIVEISPDDFGLYMKLQFDKSNRYWDIVDGLINSGKVGLSTGTVGHLARRKGKKIVVWPVVEVSVTGEPAEVRTVGVERLTKIAQLNDNFGVVVFKEEHGNALEEMTKQSLIEVIKTSSTKEEEISMNEEALNEMNGRIDALSDTLEKFMSTIENSPVLKRAGYTTDDGGDADPSHKSFGDFLLAVRRGDTKRLSTVYKARRDDGDTKDISGTAGSTGGYLVPTEHLTPLLQLAAMQSPVYQRVQKVPVTRDAGEWPALDQYLTPTAGSGQTAMAGGVVATAKASGAELDETQPEFSNIEWRIHKLGGYVEVHNEIVSDSPESIEALLRGLFGIAIAAKTERHILRGNGAGEPLGILNAPCAIGISPATNNVFSYADALAMRARFKMAGGTPVWLIHPGVWPDLGVFETTNGGGVWLANQSGSLPSTLLGYPIIESEHMPQDDNSGSVILADLNAYLLFERQSLSIAFSEHAAFKSDKGTWRFTSRMDGQPWLKSAITLADPQGSYTVSPFVYHND